MNERESLHGQKCAGFVPVSRWIEVYLFDPLLQAARPSRHAVLLFCLAASGLIFAGDLLSPSAAVPEILYGAVLLGSLWTRRPAVTVGLAGLCTFLIPLGHFLQLQEIPLGVAVANRSFILLMLWVVTGLVCAVHSILACVQERTRALHEDIRRREEAEEALHLRSQQLESVRAVTEEITRELDLTALLHLIHERVLALAQGDSGTVWLWDEGAQLLLPTSWPGLGAWMGDVRLRPNEGVAGTVAARRQGMCVNDFRNSRYVYPLFATRMEHIHVLAEPLLYREQLVGVLSVNRNDPTRPFTPEDQRLVRLFAAQAAIAIEHARLFQEQQRAYAQLQQAQEELIRAEKLRALGQMAAGVAHDLNNVLAAILGQAELLQLRVKLPEIQEALRVLYTAASDGAQVVRRLQEFGRQQPTAPLLPCDLAPIVHETLELTRPHWQGEAQREGRVIQVYTAVDGLPRILGHPAELREALTNLILNAVDALPTGGTLTLAGYPDPTPLAAPERAGVCLTITDTGIGMAEEVRRHIFDPFYTTKGVRGTGLGLAVVYGILERHGGHIDVTSTPGQGTTFTLRFQAALSDPRTAPVMRPAHATAPRRILLIDDESPVRTSLADLLRAVGHDITEAESGTAGLIGLAAQAVDLVITDLGMPDMTGWEVAQRVKAMHPRLPVVLLTGWGQQISDAAPGNAYVDRVLAKPIRLAELQETIAEFTVSKETVQPGP